MSSSMTNCHIIKRNNDPAPYMFYFADKPAHGDCYVQLDGYLICPMDMFTPRQIKMAMKKYPDRNLK